MDVRQMQIEFERSIQLIDENFVLKDKLDTENILYFLNIAQDRYLKQTYLSKTSLQDNIQFLQKRADDLKQLVERSTDGRCIGGVVLPYITLLTEVDIPTGFIGEGQTYKVSAAGAETITYPVGGTAYSDGDTFVGTVGNKEYTDTGADVLIVLDTTQDGGDLLRVPYDYIYYMLSRSKITRSTVAVANAEWTSNKVITHDELDNVIQTPFNDPILRKPCILFEGADSMAIYDDSDTSITDFELIYIRKPKKLILDTYTEITSTGAIGGSVGDVYTIVSDAAVIDPEGGDPTFYDIGDTYTIVNILDELDSGTIALSHLAFGTNTCELADYTHQEIVDLAVKIFIEEVKYKLLPTERAYRVGEAQSRDVSRRDIQ